MNCLIKQVISSASILLCCGCSTYQNHFGIDEHRYGDAQMNAELKIPTSMLERSHRYDIPPVSGQFVAEVNDIQPPDYE